MVIDLRGPAHFNVNQTENGITVAFAAPAAVKSTPEAQPAEVTTTKADTKASITPVQSATPVQSSAQAISIPAPVAALPAALAGTSTALASPAIAQPAAKIEAAKPSAAPAVVVSIPGVTPDAPAAEAAQQAATPRSGRPLFRRAHFGKFERRGPARLLPPDPRNQRPERGGRPGGQGFS